MHAHIVRLHAQTRTLTYAQVRTHTTAHQYTHTHTHTHIDMHILLVTVLIKCRAPPKTTIFSLDTTLQCIVRSHPPVSTHDSPTLFEGTQASIGLPCSYLPFHSTPAPYHCKPHPTYFQMRRAKQAVQSPAQHPSL